MRVVPAASQGRVRTSGAAGTAPQRRCPPAEPRLRQRCRGLLRGSSPLSAALRPGAQRPRRRCGERATRRGAAGRPPQWPQPTADLRKREGQGSRSGRYAREGSAAESSTGMQAGQAPPGLWLPARVPPHSCLAPASSSQQAAAVPCSAALARAEASTAAWMAPSPKSQRCRCGATQRLRVVSRRGAEGRVGGSTVEKQCKRPDSQQPDAPTRPSTHTYTHR